MRPALALHPRPLPIAPPPRPRDRQLLARLLRTIATEHFVSAQWEIWATPSGEFNGIAPDGARVVFDGVALYRMEGRRIAETWLTINEPLLLSLLGKGEARAA